MQFKHQVHEICKKQAVPDHWFLAIRVFKPPRTKHDMMCFFKQIGYYRRFVEGYSSLLTTAVRENVPSRVQSCNEMPEVFKSLCVSLVSLCVIVR